MHIHHSSSHGNGEAEYIQETNEFGNYLNIGNERNRGELEDTQIPGLCEG